MLPEISDDLVAAVYGVYSCKQHKPCGKNAIGTNALDNFAQLDNFLAGVEKRAYRIALVATADRDEALDIVQEAMIKLAQAYGQKASAQWPPLFHRILQNTIMDWHRKQKVRRKWQQLLSWVGGEGENPRENDSTAATVANEDCSVSASLGESPVRQLIQQQTLQALDLALHQLPVRQQQAFLLRIWEGLNVEQTAQAMACSQGSVKTHLSRAIHSLRDKLGDHYD